GGTAVTQLDGGILELDSISINDQLLDPSLYRLIPRNAPATGWPFYAIKWSKQIMQRYLRRSSLMEPTVTISARWGFCTTYPADAWQQILQAAGLVTLTQIENRQSIGSISQEGFSKSFDIVGILTQKDTADRWRREFPASILRYKRPIC
ncbi:MAG TPA: hypothetical protein VGB45_08400, partial [Abditibacterium sp.]